MPVTTLFLLILSVAASIGLTIWAIASWGVAKVVVVGLLVAVMLRWALKTVPLDDSRA